MKASTTNTVVIDNDPSMHQRYRTYFDSYDKYALTGTYTRVEEALTKSDWVSPEIILMEIALPVSIGMDDIRKIRKKDSAAKIIIVSVQNEFEIIRTAFKNGANGFLTKPIEVERLNHALDSVKSSGVAISSDVAFKVVSMFQRKTFDVFSERENQIIDYLSQGATYKTIAEKLFVSASTVNFHIQNIYLKLDVNSKSEALAKLREMEYAATG